MITKFKSLSNKQVKRFVSLILIIVLGAGSSAAVFGMSNDVTIIDGTNVTKIRTLHNETAAVLKQAGILVNNKDKVIRTDLANNQFELKIKRAFTVNVFFEGESHYYEVNDGTVADLIALHDIPVGDGFHVSVPMDEPLADGMKIVISRLIPINVLIDGETRAVSVPEGTVADALRFLDISTSPDDIVSEPLDRVVEDGLSITVNRVEVKEVTEREPIPFATEVKKSDSLSRGEFKIEVAGINGEKDVTKRIKYIDGKPSQVEVLAENILKAPVNQVKIVGTKATSWRRVGRVSISEENGTIVDENGVTHKYNKIVKGPCTAYTGDSRTATGEAPFVGSTAANPKIFGFGKKVYVKGPNKILLVNDTGGAAMNNKIVLDIFHSTEAECKRFGNQLCTVFGLD